MDLTVKKEVAKHVRQLATDYLRKVGFMYSNHTWNMETLFVIQFHWCFFFQYKKKCECDRVCETYYIIRN